MRRMGVVTDETGESATGAIDNEIGGSVSRESGDEDCLGAVVPAAFPAVK